MMQALILRGFRRPLLALVSTIGLLGLLGSSGVRAEPNEVDAALLQQVFEAAERLPFQGMVVQQDHHGVSIVRLQQKIGRDGRMTRLETLKPSDHLAVGEVIRSGRELKAYVPGLREVRIGPDDVIRPDFPQLFLPRPERLLSHYKLSLSDGPLVAGLSTRLISLQPLDRYRWPVRIWIDRVSQLPLKVQQLSFEGEILEELSFSEVLIGARARPEVNPRQAPNASWHALPADRKRRDLPRLKAVLTPVAGFRLVGGYESIEAQGPRQLVLSDGLAMLSLFVEKRSTDRTRTALGRQGSHAMAVKQRGDYLLTAVGEVPRETALMMVEEFPLDLVNTITVPPAVLITPSPQTQTQTQTPPQPASQPKP